MTEENKAIILERIDPPRECGIDNIEDEDMIQKTVEECIKCNDKNCSVKHSLSTITK